MSRSYRKFLSVEWNPYPSFYDFQFEPPKWGAIRQAELLCCRKEMHGLEYGDVVFPRYYRAAKGSWFMSSRKYYAKGNIRENYFTEIKIIFGYQNWWSLRQRDRHREQPEEDSWQASFIERFHRIKRGEIRVECYEWYLEWLHTRKVKKAIKKWEGDPLDILNYLARSRLIEKAVRDKCKRMLKK